MIRKTLWLAVLIVAATTANGVQFSGGVHMVVTDPPPEVTLQPQSQSKTVGQSVTFTTDGTGDLPLSLRWQFNSSDIPGATLSNYTISSVELSHAGGYRCVLTSSKGVSANTDTATLVVYHLLRPLVQPVDHPNVVVGATAVFSVEFDGEGALAYQWAKDGTLPANYIAGATQQAFMISNAQVTDNGNYACIVTDSRPADGGGPQVLASYAALLNVVASVTSPELMYTHAAAASTMTGVFNAHNRTLPEMLASPGTLPAGKTLADVTGLELVFSTETDEFVVRYTVTIPADGDSASITVNGVDAVDWDGNSHTFELAGFVGQTRMSFMIGTEAYGASNDVVVESLIQGAAPKVELVKDGIWRDISTP